MSYIDRKGLAFQKESFWSTKGLHLGGKRSPFGGQKGYIWRAKGVLLENDCF